MSKCKAVLDSQKVTKITVKKKGETVAVEIRKVAKVKKT
jgi:hypothetical protein